MVGKKTEYGLEEFRKEFGRLTFARVIKSYRECEKLTQTELALVLEITSGSLCDLEKGRKIPSPERAFVIASQLGEPVEIWVQSAIQDQLEKYNIDLQVSVAKTVA